MSAVGPKRHFAAVQRYDRCRWNTGRSVHAANTIAPDPERASPALDARMNFDHNALPRHPKVTAMRDFDEEYPFENEASGTTSEARGAGTEAL
jgi:succinyl-CoA synthetase beta subunit